MGKMTEASAFMNQLRVIVLENYKEGKVLDSLTGRYIRKQLDADRLKLMRDLTEFLMETDYISEESKIYLSVPYITYKGVVDEMYIRHNKIVNLSTVQSKIWYDKGKLVKEFGADMPLDIIEYTNKDVKIYMDKLATLRLKVNKVNILDNVALDFPKETIYCDSISDEEFEEFLDIIAPYTKKCMGNVVKNIDEKVLGYIRYITTHKCLNDTDKQRYADLKELIG